MDGASPLAGQSASAYAGESMAMPFRELFRVVGRRSLVSRIFAANAVIFIAAYLILVFAPVTISVPVAADQLLVLTIGLVVLFVVDLVVVRRAIAPLRRLTDFCAEISTINPGRRLTTEPGQDQEVRELTEGFNTMLDRLESERSASGRQAVAAQEGERERVARALHDELGQTLTAMTLSAQRATGDDPAEMRVALEGIAETSQRTLDYVRQLARDLRPEALDDLGLVNALIALARRIDQRSGVRIRHELKSLPPINTDTELALYRVAQESLTNVIRHSGATEAKVSLRPENGSVVLRRRR